MDDHIDAARRVNQALAVADVDLVYVGLRVLLASVATLERMAELEVAS